MGKKVRLLTLLIAQILLFVFVTAQLTYAGTIRHDRDDSDYRELATQFPSVGLLTSGGSATLITPNYILTAAHIVDDPIEAPQVEFRFPRMLAVGPVAAWIRLHDGYNPITEHLFNDMAVVRLTEPILDVVPAVLYEGSSEMGKEATIVGTGRTGTGLTGSNIGTHIERAGCNMIDGLNIVNGYLQADFDNPDYTEACELEYCYAPGDSGGSVFIDDGGQVKLVGINSYIQPPCDEYDVGAFYGTTMNITRVSPAIAWINSILAISEDMYWTGQVDVNFTNHLNWQNAIVPGAADIALFDTSGTFTVLMPSIGSISNNRLIVEEGNVTFDLNGRIYSLTSTSLPSIAIGSAASGVTLTINNGQLHGNEVLIDGFPCTVRLLDGGMLTTNSIQNNDGHIRLTGGSITATNFVNSYVITGYGNINASLQNEGSISSDSGTLTINGNFFNDGTATVDQTGSFTVSGEEWIGYNGTGTLTQTGGTHTTGYLFVNSASRYEISGGILEVTNGTDVSGTLDFAGGNANVIMGGMVDFENATITNAGSVSFTVNSGAIVIWPPGFDPNVEFGSFTHNGSTHTPGTTLVVPDGQSIILWGDFDDHVECEGVINAIGSGLLNLNGGIGISGNGIVKLGEGYLTVNDSISGISNTGQLWAKNEYIGKYKAGTFVQSGGTNTASNSLYLAYGSGSNGEYMLSGTSQLSVNRTYIGYSGPAHFEHAGGTHTVSDKVYLGYGSSSNGEYELGGNGDLTSNSQYIGHYGSGTFLQTGGTNWLNYGLVLGDKSDSSGTYQLSGTGQLSANRQIIGASGIGAFAQTNGTNSARESMYIGYYPGSNGIYELSGTGHLSAPTIYIGYNGNGDLNWMGGTLDATTINIDVNGTMNVSLDWNYEGVLNIEGGTLNLAGHTLTLEGDALTTHDGGSVNVGNLHLGSSLGTGAYKLIGSELNVQSAINIGVGTGIGRLEWYDGLIATPEMSIGSNGTLAMGFDFNVGDLTSGNLFLSGGSLLGLVSGTLEVANGATATQNADDETGVGILMIGTGAGDGAYNLNEGSLYAGLEYLGCGGPGIFTQSNGDNATDDLYVGFSSMGHFIQTGGTNMVESSLLLGYHYGSNGTYELSGEGQLSASYEAVGYNNGDGQFVQNGGTNTADFLEVGGHHGSSDGMYDLVDGQLSVGEEEIGHYSDGQFIQRGGTHTVNELNIGHYCDGSPGSYELVAGYLEASVLRLGLGGVYEWPNPDGIIHSFTQTGGINKTDELYLGYGAYGRGAYTLTAGELDVLPQEDELVVIVVGNEGDGAFVQSGGIVLGVRLYIGSGIFTEEGGVGSYTITGDELTMHYDEPFPGPVPEEPNEMIESLPFMPGISVGRNGTGLFDIAGGIIRTDLLYVGGFNENSSGTLKITDNLASVYTHVLVLDENATFSAAPCSTIHMTKLVEFEGPDSLGPSFINWATDMNALSGLSNLELIFDSCDPNVGWFEVAGADFGTAPNGFSDNFELRDLVIGPNNITSVQLIDSYDNRPDWEGSEALYVSNLSIGNGSTLDLNGFNLYYIDFTDLGGNILLNGGSLTQATGTVIGDFTGNNEVDFADFAMFASAWLTADGQPNYDSKYDISEPPDGEINELDLLKFAENWLWCKCSDY